MSSKSDYPWFFFYRIARLTLVIFIPTLFIILFLYRSSYRTGIISQMGLHIAEDLRLIQHTVEQGNIEWEKWCRSLPLKNDVRYLLIGPNEKILCQSHEDFLEDEKPVSGSLKVGQNLTLQKIIPASSLRENMDKFDRVLFLRIVPFAFISYLLFIFLFYRSTRPLGVILSKVQKFKDDIPFKKNLALFYQKDEWSSIEEALNKADQKLQKQVQEVKLENEKNTAILESINDDIIAIDRFESILFFNSKFQNNFIKNRDGLEINKKIWHIFDEEVSSAFRSVLNTGTPSSLKTMKFPMSHRPNRYFDLTITPLKSSNGTINGALGVFYDVTDFKLTEQMRVDFIANVSHEIRTPLTSIKGFTQILQTQSEKIDPGLHPFLDKIITNTERMISLFNDLLNLSVLKSRNDLFSEEFSLIDIVSEVEGNILASYPDKNVNFQVKLELEHLKGDFRLIEQVLLNLSDNACKYAGDSVDINISSYKKDNSAFLVVKDNGPGISAEHLPRIFERFYRVDASRESLRGTGLGLAIVKQIISKHNGKIWAESEGIGKGTSFVIELPLE